MRQLECRPCVGVENTFNKLPRCRLSLADKNPLAARRAGQVIENQFILLETTPDIGRPLEDHPDFRELVITFGESGYVAPIVTN